jgi:hypothetical protein
MFLDGGVERGFAALIDFQKIIWLSQDCVRRGGLILGYFHILPNGRFDDSVSFLFSAGRRIRV